MSADRPFPLLEHLAHSICNFEDIDRKADLLVADIQDTLGLTNVRTELMTLMLRFFSVDTYSDPEQALAFLVADRRVMTRLANHIADSEDESYCSPNADMKTGACKVLEALGFPIVDWPQAYESFSSMNAKLDRAQVRINQLTAEDRDECKNFLDLGWGYLEMLLKVSLNFYGEVFGSDESSPVAEAFQKARKPQGLNQRLDKVRHVQRVFGKVDVEREMCQWYFKRDTPFGDFLEGKHQVDLDGQADGWCESLARFHERDNDEATRLEIDELIWCKTNVDFYRNFYHHATPPAMARSCSHNDPSFA